MWTDCQALFTEDQSQALLVLTAPARTEGYEKLQLLAVLGQERFAEARLTHKLRIMPDTDPMRVTVLVNGRREEVRTEQDTALLYVLRNHLGLKGTRFGCGLGVCGACLVLVDGRPAYSCDTPMWAVEDREVKTVEGLGTPERPHPVAQAIIDGQAAQCGYCISGVVISAVALLAANDDPSEDQVRAALDGNLCRCGAHNRMVRAVLAAAFSLRASRDGD